MIKTVLVDDEPLALALLRKYLEQYPQFEIIGQCLNGYEALPILLEKQPDLIFLDIQMPKISGFELLEIIQPHQCQVIFTTAFDEYAVKAFEYHAVDYLLKPFSTERFNQAIQHFLATSASKATSPFKPTGAADAADAAPSATNIVKENPANGNANKGPYTQLLADSSKSPNHLTKIVVRSGHAINIVPVNQIHYLEAYDDYVKVVVADNIYLKNQTMAYYEKALTPEQFIRIHRSYIVNASMITRLMQTESGSHQVLLKTGVVLPVSKTGHTRLKSIF